MFAAVSFVTACSTASNSFTMSGPVPDASERAPSPDPRVGLSAGWLDAGEAAWNVRLVSSTPPPEEFVGVRNSDLAFYRDYAIQGNYNGYAVWDISNPENPFLEVTYVCPASQSDVSFYGNLLFVSGESLGGRLDCGTQGVPEPVSQDRLRGIRIFDASDIANPKYIANVQTCRGSHTHTVVTDPNDDENVYIYVSGSSRVRSGDELPGCVSAPLEDDPNTALFRIEVIQVPLANPTAARIVSSPRIFDDLATPERHAELPPDSIAGEARRRARGLGARGPRTGPTQCHDITVYPEIGWAGGACRGYGLLLDIADVRNPRRVYAAADSNFSLWHSATFSNDGTKVLFTDEWGGGSQPRCRLTDKYEWGANALFTVEGDDLVFQSYYKMPAPQTTAENCVAHNGSLIPVPGRDIMVQGWYQGGISIFAWTDPANPVRDRLSRPWPHGRRRTDHGGFVVCLLVQRLHDQLGNRPRSRRLRADCERPALSERNRCRQDSSSRDVQRAGATTVHLATELCHGRCVSRSAPPRKWSGVGYDQRGESCPG